MLGLFVPCLREVADVGFTWDRPYAVDRAKFMRHFGFTPTPYNGGAPATAPAPRSPLRPRADASLARDRVSA